MPKTDQDVRVGDFSRPIGGGLPKAPVKPQESPAEKRLESAEAALDKEAAEVQQQLSPLEAYEKRLTEIGVTRNEAADMVDKILEQGFWAEDITITSRIKVRFRTRQYRDVERLRNFLEVQRPVFPDYYNEILYKYQLAASLERYKDVTFKHPGKKDTKEQIDAQFGVRLDFVENLSDSMFRLLSDKLRKFDDKVRVVFEEGAIENF